MSRLRSTAGLGVISLVVSMLILFLLMTVYLREFAPAGPKGGTPGTALEATKQRAHEFEEQQKQRIDQMNQAAQQAP